MKTRVLTGLLLIVLLAGMFWVFRRSSRRETVESKAGAPSATMNADAFDATLPVLGSVQPPLPEGAGKIVAVRACLPCHSGEILRQQQLNEKQWTASVAKMIGWGAEVTDDEKAGLIAYLVSNFGPSNDRFEPPVTRPAGR